MYNLLILVFNETDWIQAVSLGNFPMNISIQVFWVYNLLILVFNETDWIQAVHLGNFPINVSIQVLFGT